MRTHTQQSIYFLVFNCCFSVLIMHWRSILFVNPISLKTDCRCWIDPEKDFGKLWIFAVFYGPLWIVIIITAVLSSLVIRSVSITRLVD